MSFQKNNIPWNKGKKTPESVKEKQRQAKLKKPVRYWLGKKHSEVNMIE